jgi:hypothetical protein
LKPSFVIPRRAVKPLATFRVEAVRITDLRYFFPQLGDAFFDRILHDDRLLTRRGGRITVAKTACSLTDRSRHFATRLLYRRAMTPQLFGMGLSTDPRPCCSRE